MTIDDFQMAGIRHDGDGVIKECSKVFNSFGSKVL